MHAPKTCVSCCWQDACRQDSGPAFQSRQFCFSLLLATILEALRGLYGVGQRYLFPVKMRMGWQVLHHISGWDLAQRGRWMPAPCRAFPLSLGVLRRWHQGGQIKQSWHGAPCAAALLLGWVRCCGTRAARRPRAAHPLGLCLVLAGCGSILLQCLRLTVVSG